MKLSNICYNILWCEKYFFNLTWSNTTYFIRCLTFLSFRQLIQVSRKTVKHLLCRLYNKRHKEYSRDEHFFGANWKITIVLPILPRRQIIIQIITTTINLSDFRNQNIRFPTNHCARRSVCNTNIIIFHNITQSPCDNTRLCRRNCIFRWKPQLYLVLSVQRTSFPGNTPVEAGRQFIISSDWLPLVRRVGAG